MGIAGNLPVAVDERWVDEDDSSLSLVKPVVDFVAVGGSRSLGIAKAQAQNSWDNLTADF
jgi:hypothetical protein